jgi:hypothetical protein
MLELSEDIVTVVGPSKLKCYVYGYVIGYVMRKDVTDDVTRVLDIEQNLNFREKWRLTLAVVVTKR